ncbi:hypothetical protein T02_4049 [Trichinella nativa]|uniref:Uncharacterized protein n=1 Tax=Trichinella nativa TaxID=6335 RepID=A0A0V1LCN8_9BILA|nr:hypothetical protein T02_4049 [Trichinella nativa]
MATLTQFCLFFALFPCAVVPELLLALLSLRRASNSVSETQLPHTVRLNKEWTTRFASDNEDDDGKLSVFTSRERSGGRTKENAYVVYNTVTEALKNEVGNMNHFYNENF